MAAAITRAFSGQERLSVVFWLYAVLGGLIVSALSNFGLSVANSAGVRVLGIGISVAVVLTALVYYAWAFVSVWRCAFNVHRRIWGYVARVYAVAQAGLIAYALVSVPWLSA